MIHIFIPLIFFISLGHCLNKKYALLSIISYIIAIILLLFGIVSVKRLDIIEKIPFASIDDNMYESVSNKGSFSIESGSSALLSTEFVFTDETTVEEIGDYLGKTNKATYIYVKEGSEIVWAHNLGVIDEAYSSQLLDTYNSWKDNGTVPKDKVRYKFLFFYIDV